MSGIRSLHNVGSEAPDRIDARRIQRRPHVCFKLMFWYLLIAKERLYQIIDFIFPCHQLHCWLYIRIRVLAFMDSVRDDTPPVAPGPTVTLSSVFFNSVDEYAILPIISILQYLCNQVETAKETGKVQRELRVIAILKESK